MEGLFAIVRQADVSKLRAYVEKFPDSVNQQNERGLTALYWVCERNRPGSVDMARVLVEHGADVNIVTAPPPPKRVPSLLSPALLSTLPSSPLVLFLMRLTMQSESNGFTALHLAAYVGHKEVAQYLCEHGADVNKANKANRLLPFPYL